MTLYFSQLTLNPHSRMVQAELNNPYECHRTLLNGFDMSRAEAGMLHRVEADRDGVRVLVQSAVQPNWHALNDVGQGHYLLHDAVKSADLTLPIESVYRFRLRANPTITRVVRNEQGERRKNGRREALLSTAKQCAWLRKKSADHGFEILRYQISDGQFYPNKQGKGKVFTVQFDGLLQITRPDKFNDAWRKGIGPAKAFGCGLLSLARA